MRIGVDSIFNGNVFIDAPEGALWNNEWDDNLFANRVLLMEPENLGVFDVTTCANNYVVALSVVNIEHEVDTCMLAAIPVQVKRKDIFGDIKIEL
ncbi:hypothetical protein [Pseudobutyrivibrio ruminis]|uniref:hypothetical protein n=1 Tax=Pseudobutyrivibrio ruminis TaxID=46206 RepID=UPI00051BADA7|nr:hypothetical protein [Pseudobutyrivibrio ruminis]